MGCVTFNGIQSQDLHIQVEAPPEYETPERDYDVQHVPGRNGDIVQDNGSYKNVDRPYKIAIGSFDETYTVMANRISKWLHAKSGYGRLEDSYEPDYYRLGMYLESGSIENLFEHAGRTTIKFNCKPQRFLKSGEVTQILTTNPTDFVALPIITVKGTGNGVLHVGASIVTITNIINYITLNCEIGDAYNGLINLNSYIVLSNKEFPKLVPGDNAISFSGGITSVEVTPNWWTI